VAAIDRLLQEALDLGILYKQGVISRGMVRGIFECKRVRVSPAMARRWLASLAAGST